MGSILSMECAIYVDLIQTITLCMKNVSVNQIIKKFSENVYVTALSNSISKTEYVSLIANKGNTILQKINANVLILMKESMASVNPPVAISKLELMGYVNVFQDIIKVTQQFVRK